MYMHILEFYSVYGTLILLCFIHAFYSRELWLDNTTDGSPNGSCSYNVSLFHVCVVDSSYSLCQVGFLTLVLGHPVFGFWSRLSLFLLFRQVVVSRDLFCC